MGENVGVVVGESVGEEVGGGGGGGGGGGAGVVAGGGAGVVAGGATTGGWVVAGACETGVFCFLGGFLVAFLVGAGGSVVASSVPGGAVGGSGAGAVSRGNTVAAMGVSSVPPSSRNAEKAPATINTAQAARILSWRPRNRGARGRKPWRRRGRASRSVRRARDGRRPACRRACHLARGDGRMGREPLAAERIRRRCRHRANAVPL